MATSDLIDVPWEQLGKRSEAFRLIVDLMPPQCRIVETGSVRKAGNWIGDGQSTVVWDQVASVLGGHVTTVDIDPIGAALVTELGLANTTAVTSDSLPVLRALTEPVDLLYLDSFDINFAVPEPAQHHHLCEIVAAWHLLRRGSLVGVDDNTDESGKGKSVGEFLEAHGAIEIHTGYVRVWRVT